MPRSLRVVSLAALALLFFGGPSLLTFYTDWLWFGEVGYQHVFATILRGQGTLFVLVLVASFAWLSLNLRYALRTIGEGRAVFTTREGFEVALPGRHQLTTLANVVALVVAVLIGLFAANRWDIWLTWRYALPFG